MGQSQPEVATEVAAVTEAAVAAAAAAARTEDTLIEPVLK